MNTEDKLNELERLERENSGEGLIKNDTNNVENLKPDLTGIVKEQTVSESEEYTEDDDNVVEIKTNTPTYNSIDNFRILERMSLPYEGRLYPESWNFTFRCPTTSEVANFSTLNENDPYKIQEEITTLIKKCYVIIDSDTGNQVSAGQINDGDRLFFFLKLREYYMEDMPIEFPIISLNHQEPLQVTLMAHNLIYRPIKDKLLECYDGRKWTIPVPGRDSIVFLNPTLEISQRIFKYMVNKYREASDKNQEKKLDKKEFNKKFLMLLPFLYETGHEKVESLHLKFKKIEKDETLLKAYIALATKMVHQNEEYIIIDYKGDEEKTEIRFPGGWKNMFINKKLFDEYFD